MFRVQDVLDSTGATLLRGDAGRLVRGVSTDTRTLRPHQLYLALSGPNFDGNRFAAGALRAGAGAVLLRGGGDAVVPGLDALGGDAPVLAHEDPRRALADLARWHRGRLHAAVIGITGSCGKTTTKNILATLLGGRMRTVASPSSFNNDVGVPHTLLLADATTEALVVEIGTNRPGEIAALAAIARPTVAVVTSVGASHLEGLGSIEGVAREKSELFAALPRDGVAVLDLDCRYRELLRARVPGRAITVSVEGEGELDASRLLFHSGGTTFRLLGHEITSPLLGLHNVSNLLCAFAAGLALGFDLEELLPAVSELSSGHRRMERHDLGRMVVFDDTYNANPESARAAVRVLSGIHPAQPGGRRARGRRVLVLGDMLELGPEAPELHHAIGRDAAASGLDGLVLVGDLVRATAAGALEAGMPASRVVHFRDAAEAERELPGLFGDGDTVLFKASRRVGLDKLVESLVSEARRAPAAGSSGVPAAVAAVGARQPQAS
jgi:UDP-N-acetylmuramoyl-tripeptide--D-alanyl-D-alanine ligase